MKKIMLLSEENEEFLQHFGVKGMRWGVRKKRESGGGSSGGKVSAAEIRKNREAGVAEARKRTGLSSSGKKISKMTDKELDRELEELSIHYSLTDHKKDISRAKKVVAGYLVAAGGLKLAQVALNKWHQKRLMDHMVQTMGKLDAARIARGVIHL